MPELPEVETIKRDLERCLPGRRILAVKLFSKKTALPGAAFFKSALLNRKITGLERRGKLLIIGLDKLGRSKRRPAGDADYLLIHLKMTGQLIYSDAKQTLAGGHSDLKVRASGLNSDSGAREGFPNRHTRAAISLQGGAVLYFNDLRRFGYMRVVSRAELDLLLSTNYGPEPLTKAFTVTALSEILKGKKVKIKALLLDQKRVAGLGNIYVDEALYAAKINPERLAGGLRELEIVRLYREISRLIKTAVKHRGTTFSDYVDSQGKKGNFSRFLKVYGRQGNPCPECGGVIVKIKLAGRGTHYCPICQS